MKHEPFPKTVSEIASLIGGKVVGDPQCLIQGISGLPDAKAGDLSFLAQTRYRSLLKGTQASAVITSLEEHCPGVNLIQTEDPSYAFSLLLQKLYPQQTQREAGVDSRAHVSESARIDPSASVQAGAVIEEGAEIGAQTHISANSYVGLGVQIGNNCMIGPNVSLLEGTVIKDRVTVHSGTVLGSDGFGYLMKDGQHVKIPQIGLVVVHDDVEIGSNVTVDRARFDQTVIGQGTKIDNLVQIAHNVQIGKHCLIIAQSGIAGSAKIGDYVTVAAQSGVIGHVEICDKAVFAARSAVTKSIDQPDVYSGFPAIKHRKERKLVALRQQLPEFKKRLDALEQKD